RIEMSNPLAPHSDERLRCQLVYRFPRAFYGRKRIPPDRAFAPSFAFLHAFAGGTHGFPSDAIRLADVLGGAFPALLMDQVKIAQVRLPVCHPLEQNAFGNDLIGCRNGIIAGIENVSGAEFAELVFAQLEQPDIRPGALLGVETGLDLSHRLHESEIQTESVGRALDLFHRRSDRDVLERTQDDRSRLLGRRLFGPDVTNEIPEILRPRAGGTAGCTARCRHQLRGITVARVRG